MTKILSVTLLGLAVAGVTLATPAASHAQVPVGVSVNVGPVGIRAGFPAYPVVPVTPYPVYVQPAPVYYPPAVVPVGPTVVVRPGPVWVYHGHHHGHWRR